MNTTVSSPASFIEVSDNELAGLSGGRSGIEVTVKVEVTIKF